MSNLHIQSVRSPFDDPGLASAAIEAAAQTAGAPQLQQRAAALTASFAVEGGRVKRVRQVEPGLWRVRIQPKAWKDVTVTLAGGRGCAEAGAVCAADGRALSNTASATVGGPVRLRIAGGRAREGHFPSYGGERHRRIIRRWLDAGERT